MATDETNGVCVAKTGRNWSAYSLQGRTRDRNSDAFAVFDDDVVQVFALADGVGSLPGSPLASRTAVDAVLGAADLGLFEPTEGGAVEALAVVSECVGFSLSEAELQGATTLAMVINGRVQTSVLSVGDSEVHEVLATGESHLLHELDHIPSRPNVLLAWIDGHAAVEPRTGEVSPQATHLVLMSDGVPGSLDRGAIADIVRTSQRDSAARELVLAAREAGANDDLTAVVVRLEKSDSPSLYRENIIPVHNPAAGSR